MKKILFVTLVCIWSVVSMYAWDRNILISTKNTSLLFAAQNDGDLRFAYYGDKITPDQINQIHDIWAGLNRPAISRRSVRNIRRLRHFRWYIRMEI